MHVVYLICYMRHMCNLCKGCYACSIYYIYIYAAVDAAVAVEVVDQLPAAALQGQVPELARGADDLPLVPGHDPQHGRRLEKQRVAAAQPLLTALAPVGPHGDASLTNEIGTPDPN